MIAQVRKDLLAALAELSEHTSCVRFGQLIANLSYLAKGPTQEAIWDADDIELLEAARAHLNELREKTQPAA